MTNQEFKVELEAQERALKRLRISLTLATLQEDVARIIELEVELLDLEALLSAARVYLKAA